MYTYNEEYKVLKAYDPYNFILGLKEVCGINIDMDKSYIGSMFSYQLLVDGEYVVVYDRITFMQWIVSKLDVMQDNSRSYLTSLDYQLTFNSDMKQTKQSAKRAVKVEEVIEMVENEEVTEEPKAVKKPRVKKTLK